jgi:putative ABC transport system ATP-binding protein
VNQPQILLADEPTGALDSKSGEQIMKLFRELSDDGVTILMITHDREVAEHADRIVTIRDGILRSADDEQAEKSKQAEVDVYEASEA